MSWLNKSPKGAAFTRTHASWVTPVRDLGSYSTHSRGGNTEMLIIPHKNTRFYDFSEVLERTEDSVVLVQFQPKECCLGYLQLQIGNKVNF